MISFAQARERNVRGQAGAQACVKVGPDRRPQLVCSDDDQVLERLALVGKLQVVGCAAEVLGDPSVAATCEGLRPAAVLMTVGKRRTTGMKKEMQVLYIEVVATHDGPEPCVGVP